MPVSHLRLLRWAVLFALALALLGGAVARADGPPTKLGMGLYRESHAARDAIFAMRPPVVLMLDPSAKLPFEIKQQLPQTLLIGRHSIEDTMTVEGATRFADEIARRYGDLKGAVTAWTFYNEPPVQKPSEAEAFDRAQAAFTERMHAQGFKVVGFNFGVGVLEPADYVRLFPRSLPLVDYIGVHAYGSQNDMLMSGPDRDYYALRYRKIRAATLAAGIDKPFILTETGTWSGWQGKLSVYDVAQDYLWLESQIQRDDYVIGQVPFLLDGFNWDGFKLLGSAAVPTFAAQNAGRSPAVYATRTPTPTPTLTPTPAPVDPTPAFPLDEARRNRAWLRELAKLPPFPRAQAAELAAQELGINVLTIYEWLTWLEVNGELGDLSVTPTPRPSTTPTVMPPPVVYQVFLPQLHQAQTPMPMRTPTPSPTTAPLMRLPDAMLPERSRGGPQ